jgi:ATP-dependent DNA ligase
VVRGKRLPETKSGAAHVERAVAIEQAPARLARNDASESKVRIDIRQGRALIGRHAQDRSAELPSIEPLRPVLSKTVPVGPDWIYELKLDGFRGVLAIQNGRGSFTSKTMKPMPRFQPLADAIAASLSVRNAIIDGEIVVMGNGGPDFYALMFRRGNAGYAGFDLLWLDDRDLRSEPLWRRKRALKKLAAKSSVAYPRLFDLTVANDLEGIVAKRRGDPYGVSAQWIKVKHRGYSQIQGRWELFDRKRR